MAVMSSSRAPKSTQEAPNINPTNGGREREREREMLKQERKKKKVKTRKLTQKGAFVFPLMNTINNVKFTALLCLERVTILSILDMGIN